MNAPPLYAFTFEKKNWITAENNIVSQQKPSETPGGL